RMTATEQGHGDPHEAGTAAHALLEVVLVAEDEVGPDEAGQTTGCGQSDHDGPARRDAGVLGGGGRGAEGPELEARPRALEHPPDPGGGDDGEEHAGVGRAAAE